jgi:Mor family transcriptional regulator
MPKAAPPPTPTPPGMPWDDDAAGDDIVCDILRRVVALTPGFSAALVAQLDRQVREHWGGDRPYIARRAGEGSSARNAAIRRDYRAGEHVGALCRKYRLTRQRIHQILAEGEPADVKRLALPA